MAAVHILIVEDDLNISKLLKYNLQKNGYACTVVLTGEEALSALLKEDFNLVILDVMLPKMDGFETCRRIKHDEALSSVPVLMLTARGEEIDRVVGLELGAADYLVKPFSIRELLLRIRNILQKKSIPAAASEPAATYRFGILTVDIPRHKVLVKGKAVVLTNMEFNLLVFLLQTRGRVQNREQLLEKVWDLNADVSTRTVDTHVKSLRQKMGPAGDLIETVRGVGYRLREEG